MFRIETKAFITNCKNQEIDSEINLIVGSYLNYNLSITNRIPFSINIQNIDYGYPINIVSTITFTILTNQILLYSKKYFYNTIGTFDYNIKYFFFYSILPIISYLIDGVFPLIKVNVYDFPDISFIVTGYVNNIIIPVGGTILVNSEIIWNYKITNPSNIFDLEIDDGIPLLKEETYEKEVEEISELGNKNKKFFTTITGTCVNKVFNSITSYFGANPQLSSSIAILSNCTNQAYIPKPEDLFIYNISGTYLLTLTNDGNVDLTNIQVENLTINELSVNQSLNLDIPYDTLIPSKTFSIIASYTDSVGQIKNLDQNITIKTPKAITTNTITSKVNTLLPPN